MKKRPSYKYFLSNFNSHLLYEKIRDEQVQFLYKQLSYFILIAECLAVSGLGVTLWNISNRSLITIWLLYMYLTSEIGRGILLIFYYKNKKNFSYQFWLNWFCFGVFCSGLGWGFVSLFLLPNKEGIHQIITIMILFGIFTESNNLYSPVFGVYAFFLSLAFLPLTTWLFLQGNLYNLLGLLSLLYLWVVLSAAYNHRNLLLTSLDQNDKIKAKSKELKNSLAITKAILESTDDGILVVNSDNRIEYYNQRFLEIWQFTPEFIQTHTHDDTVAKAVKQLEDPDYFRNRLEYITQHPHLDSFDELNFVNGKRFERYGKPHKLENKIIGRVWTFHEITERKEMEEKLIFQATHDDLTGLPNRAQLTKSLYQEIKYAKRFNFYLAVLFIDLDNFKSINDNLGHEAGDVLLRQVAKKLVLSLRETDTVFRFGGDEFVIFCLVQRSDEIPGLVQYIHHCLLNPVKIGLNNVFITVSMGISIYPKHGKLPSSLLKKADLAMYWAKKQGRNSYAIYRKEFSKDSKRRLALLSQLHLAIEKKQFYLVYQPIINLNTRKICSLEVLLRWDHPKMGHISPSEFIPLAEENGLITQIGEWVLTEACKQAKIWQKKGLKFMPIAVNVSGIQISNPTFPYTLEYILKENNLDPKYLIIELTESTLMANQENILTTLDQLRKMNIQISIDDFGTGYSSFAYLKDFSIDKIKIDKIFIRDCPNKANCNPIIKAIVAMGKNLNLIIVAEGVETIEQLNFLTTLHCNEIQGFLYSQPLTAEKIPQIINIDLDTILKKKGLINKQ
ncbi:inner membrane protein [Legionella busanensis]|uniref:cyclic-guanylate-specific phosphodiesterase n=1 Tax=Legionella busanensis TaxID=190655 RepID=A0A378JNW9_9GAMM|nr:bifunctional diguanylate cyclase/phosphodiesterase [Legionella busanensis]STX52378.1 inner membrane protein [Legionella busanensis]